MEFKTELTRSIFKSKYLLPNEEHPDQAVDRIVRVVGKYYPHQAKKVEEFVHNRWLLPGGGLWRSAMNPDQNVSSINCTTLPQPSDDLEAIFESYYWWAKYAAFGQGEGIDLSLLRPRGAKVHNSSHTSTGAVSFMSIFDVILNVIAQEGRRGASLISLHISHPDIPEFIFVKDEDGILTNANISIQMTDEFMRLLTQEEAVWTFFFQNKFEIIEKKVGALELFTMICEHAWKSGDPGLQFIDTARKYSNSDSLGYPIVATNACSEQWLNPDSTCFLASLNYALLNNIYSDNSYDPTDLVEITETGNYMLDAFVKYEYEEHRSPNPNQHEGLINLPRIGLGVTGLADHFLNRRVVYGSEESIVIASDLFKDLAATSYETSFDIAERNGGSFPAYNKKKYMQSDFVRRLLDEGVITEGILKMQAHVCKNTVAPNGTLTEVAEAGGGGIEPIFGRYYVRRERATTGKYKEWFTYNNAVRNYLDATGKELTKENADALTDPWWVTAHTVDNSQKIKLMGEIQKWIDSAISVTYNLPKTATVQNVQDIYYSAWENDLKGVTVYREGSKPGILITDANYNETLEEKTISNRFTAIRPTTISCDIYVKNVNKEKHIILIGLIEDKPYEIFVTNDPENKIDLDKHKKGFITKIAHGRYDLQVMNGTEKTILENIGSVFDKEYGSLSRMISMSLRHEVPIPFICDQLAKDKEFISFEKAVLRTLKNYIEEGEKIITSKNCPECGGELIYSLGCPTCMDCKWSKCD